MKLNGISDKGLRRIAQQGWGKVDPVETSISILDGIQSDAENMDPMELKRQIEYVLDLLTQIPR